MPNEVISSQAPAKQTDLTPCIINDQGHAEQGALCVTNMLARINGLDQLIGASVTKAGSPALGIVRKLPWSIGRRLELQWCQRLVARHKIRSVLAWGNKPSAARAEAMARHLGLALLRVEDGFVRSVGLGAYEQPLALVLDDLGIYYDARSASRLEKLIKNPLSRAENERAQHLIRLWREERVSKYNHCEEKTVVSGESLREPFVLVVDQTYGDASIEFGLASADSFLVMLRAAIEEYPDHKILVKTHPDVVAGLKCGHFNQVPKALQGRYHLISEDIHAPSLIENAEAVYCVTSQMGFEALLWGKRVRTFGMPFYAGWGLTDDALTPPARRRKVSLEQLVFAALVSYTRYRDPEHNRLCEVEDLLLWMGEQRRQRKVVGDIVGVNWPRWKKPVLRHFTQGANINFLKENPSFEAKTIGWGAGAVTDIRVEDGFIRSVGLGADLTLPQSWVVDDVGMYYDATRPSRLEKILMETQFSEAMRSRGGNLREQLLASNVTKYNVGKANWTRKVTDKHVILVPGQVESDASIQLGSPKLKTNIELLKSVRARCPDAHIIYKPHPDVVAGLRIAGEDNILATKYCNEIVIDQDMAWILRHVDAVHTLTSLTGFEALLRKIPVTCYGQPFYSGWGLTCDVYPLSRRKRKLSLDELVFAALVLYPSYINYNTGRYTSAERLIESLRQQRDDKVSKRRFYEAHKLYLKRKILSIRRF